MMMVYVCFIEMGPGGSCSRMIDQILADKPHFAKAICVKGQDSVDNLMQVLAQLYAEGASIDLSQFALCNETNQTEYKNYISVKTGGEAFNVPLPPKSKTTEAESSVVELKRKQQ